MLTAGLVMTVALGRLWAGDPLYLELSAHGQRLDLGLAEFSTSRSLIEEATIARQIREVVKADLLFPRVFNLVEGGPPPLREEISAKTWEDLGADVLVTGYVDTSWFGRFSFTGAIFDVSSGKLVLRKKFAATPEEYRQLAHQWSDEVIRYFLGQSGISHTQIVFVNDATGHKELCIVDYDGYNFQRLTSDRSITLFPKLSPDGHSVVFTTYRNGTPEIDVLDLEKKRRRNLCRYRGLNSVAAWLPDGESLVATLSKGRNPNLYLVDLNGRILKALTNSYAVDTAPSLSPDGRLVAFTSDRPGYPQIYTMDITGTNISRISTRGMCDSPAWSPQGNLIAYAMSDAEGNYDIHTIEVGTGYEQRLTWGGGDNENPAWSPDGLYIVFVSAVGARRKLMIMGADGSNPRPVGDIPGRSFTPHWGP